MNLSRLSTPTLRALYRIAKHPTKGARPFFRDPKAMIALRDELDSRQEVKTTVTLTVADDGLWEAVKSATKRPTFFGVRT